MNAVLHGGRRWRRRAATISLAAFAGLGGCVVAPVEPEPAYVGEVVGDEPPPPQEEVVGVAPVAGHVWIGGYWGWRGGRYAWVGGHWEAPRPGYYWAPHAWVRVNGGWRLREGHWARR